MNVELPPILELQIKEAADMAGKALREATAHGESLYGNIAFITMQKYSESLRQHFEAAVRSNIEEAVRANTRRIVLEVFDRFMLEGKSA